MTIFGFSITRAASHYGWALALAVALLAVAIVYARPVPALVPATTSHPVVVQELAVTPPLPTAADICQDPSFRAGLYAIDGHFEGQLVQNAGQANQVRYHLFWQPNPQLDVVIEETRAGTPTVSRTDPHTPQLDACLKGKKVEEVRPVQ